MLYGHVTIVEIIGGKYIMLCSHATIVEIDGGKHIVFYSHTTMVVVMRGTRDLKKTPHNSNIITRYHREGYFK